MSGFLLPFATAIRFSVTLFPPGNRAFLTVGLPGTTWRPDPGGVSTFTPARHDPGWVPLYPGTAVLLPAGCRARSAPAASQQPVPVPATTFTRGFRNRGINGGSRDSPVRSAPHLWPPDGTGGPWAYPLAPPPAVTSMLPVALDRAGPGP